MHSKFNQYKNHFINSQIFIIVIFSTNRIIAHK